MELLDEIRFDEHLFPARPECAHEYSKKVSLGYDRMQQTSAVLVGLARNVAPILPATMLRMELLGETFADYRIVLFENDSTDQTIPLLSAWSHANPKVEILSESLGAPVSRPIRCANRADRMAFYRQKCQAHIRQHHSDHPFVIVIDTDVEGGWSPDGVASTFGHDGWDFVGSNGLIYRRSGWDANATAQYDAWAYRENEDYRSLATSYVNRLQHRRGEPLVPLPSCFGGMGIYRMAAYLAGEYRGQDIEHVSFHRTLRHQGFARTYLNPSQIVLYGRKQRRWDRSLRLLQRLILPLMLQRRIVWRFPSNLHFSPSQAHFLPPRQPSSPVEYYRYAKAS
jgi:hypothetical protein